MQKSLDGDKLFTDMLNSARFLKSHELSNGKLRATGFCYGGGVVNNLAVRMGKDLDAGVPF
jgi:carboxymethylenebutenolidase